MCRVSPPRLCLWLLAAGAVAPVFGAKPVAAVGRVTSLYLERRMVDGKPRRETYVFMEGGRFNGATIDRTFERTTFRNVAEYLAPKLTQQNYWPTPEIKDADLLLIVYWGVTTPRPTFNEMTARVDLGVPGTKDAGFIPEEGALSINPLALEQRMYQLEDIAEQDSQMIAGMGTARLLGYTETLIKLGQSSRYTEEQYTLESDMRTERYFIIVRAYDLHAPEKWQRSLPVWTLHLNTASAGNNFKTAMVSMSTAGGRLFGRKTEGVSTIRPDSPNVSVELPDVVILGEAK